MRLLALVAGLVLAVSASRRRLPDALVWLVAAPVAIALAWAVTDQVMRQTFWVGVWPGLDRERLDFIAQRIGEFFGIGF